MIGRFIRWLGPGRARAIFVLFALTGLLSLMLNAVQPRENWVTFTQSGLAVGFLVGAAVIILGRFDRDERRQVLIIIGPAVVALSLGLFAPSIAPATLVIAAGWVVIALILGRAGIRQEYQKAIRFMRKGEYQPAVDIMTDLIKEEGQNADHRRFRAELYRLMGNLKRAEADYKKVAELMPKSGVGYNGLAEVCLQDSRYQEAREYGLKALSLEPNEWVPAYNLGMVEDRMGLWAEAAEHLRGALAAPIPEARHRLLAHFWALRAAVNLGDSDGAESALKALRAEKKALAEWKAIFEAEGAATLRNVLAADVALAERLISGENKPDDLVRPADVPVPNKRGTNKSGTKA